MLALFAATLFLSAALLFAVEPMFARMVLPRLGGSPAVWNTTMVLYQAALLAGYGYAHAMRRGSSPVRGAHVALMALVVAMLPLQLAPERFPGPADDPVRWLLLVMVTTVGVPFLLVSTTGPLVQRWFGQSRHPHARDPYFLYGASNVGSILGLLAYPFLLEPHWTLSQQSRLWRAGYVLLVALVAVCALAARGRGTRAADAPDAPEEAAEPIGWGRRLRWVALAFAPSSLMLGVTTHLSMDLVAMPLLWVIPLAVYLLTFIVAFARRPRLRLSWLGRALMVLVLGAMIVTVAHATQPLAFVVSLHLLTLLVAGLLCHGLLAADRPGVRHLTEYYLWLAAGGALGGVFNALLAPAWFDSVAEYPIALVLACVLAPAAQPRPAPAGEAARAPATPPAPSLPRDALVALVFVAVVTAAILAVRVLGHDWARAEFVVFVALVCLPLYALRGRPARVGLAVGGTMLAAPLAAGSDRDTVHAERSFFGIHRVQVVPDSAGSLHRLVHGTTVHGLQWRRGPGAREPLSYYHREGPAGQVFATLGPRARTVGVAGLGTGALSAYALAQQQWTYFEIDPIVARIAADTAWFTYLADAASPARMRIGDARLTLAADPARYDLLVLDAYSSDAIPVHLLTREAFRLYLDRLEPGGAMVLHLSNRYFDLEPVVARLARDAGLTCRVRSDPESDVAAIARVRFGSSWAVAVRAPAELGALAADARWRAPRMPPSAPLWTDDYSSLVRVLK